MDTVGLHVPTKETFQPLVYSSPGIIRMINSWRVRWAGHVARMGAKRNAYRILVGKQEEKRPLGRKDVGGLTILK
jgi:hypothetical protein